MRRCVFALVIAAVGGLTAASGASAQTVYFLQGEQVLGIERPGTTLSSAMTALLAGPNAAERARGLRTQVPARVRLRQVAVAGGVATVDLDPRFVKGNNAEELNARLSQLVLTATSVRGVVSVKVRIAGGTPLGLFPGVDASRAVTAKSIRTPDIPPPTAPTDPVTPATPGTAQVEQRLAQLGYLDPAKADGVADSATTNAVIAFQKWQRIERDGVVGPATSTALAGAITPTPRSTGDPTRVEVLLDRQLVLYIENNAVVRALHTSTGKSGYETPVGNYRITRQYLRDWSVPYSVWLPYASYFVGGVAFHEYPSVPTQPASHGCLRLAAGDAQWLYGRVPVARQVIVMATSA